MLGRLVLYAMIIGMNMMLKLYAGNWDTHLKACCEITNGPSANLLISLIYNRLNSSEKSWVWKWIRDDCFG